MPVQSLFVFICIKIIKLEFNLKKKNIKKDISNLLIRILPIAIAQATDMIQNNNLKNYIAYISTNFCFLVTVIKILET
jgi:hypothetical protein